MWSQLHLIRSQLHLYLQLMWSQNRDDCGLKHLVLWVATGNHQQLSTFNAFKRAAHLYPAAVRIWQEQLAQISIAQISDIFERIPDSRITPTAAKFAIELLLHNQQQIVNLEIEPISQK